MTHRFVPVAAVLGLLASTSIAFAHAHLKTATPAPDSTVQAAPTAIGIDFTEGVEPQYSSIVVQNADGQAVSTGAAATAPDNNKHLSIGVGTLAPGMYRVIWHATSVDTHKTQGTYQFTVKP
ncbi:copper homeostasis periplasmic binding protein CopC [Acidisphaera sp. L21]|uniref:copper homeostasis periplasmic binding protein CopC n=1 Tax=Acidisphaera sp. L21 TaxID=1641851 RepID=UPI00131B7573|nr:copper homeostasis periplasmic binding protein CopC [Acidisphaera sp. L21]